MADRYGFDLPDANVPAGKFAEVLEAQVAIWYQTNILKLSQEKARKKKLRKLSTTPIISLDQRNGVGPKRAVRRKARRVVFCRNS